MRPDHQDKARTESALRSLRFQRSVKPIDIARR
jgi:hypothetical protein